MKSLIALAVIAAATIAADQPELAVGTSFNAPDDQADQLVAQGLAKPADEPAVKPVEEPASRLRASKVRVLVDCALGRVNDVVTLSGAALKGAKAAGQVDNDPDAVAYALGLDQNKNAS